MTMRPIYTALAVAVFAVGAAACDRGDTRATPTESGSAQMTYSDDQLATYVQARYQRDPSIAASEIDVEARGGLVTLHGTVPTEEAREHAATLAQQMDGVRQVDNRLRVEPVASQAANREPIRGAESGAAATTRAQDGDDRSPAWITTKIQAQYFVDGDVKPWNIDVTTRNDGTVTLRGEVSDAAARTAAERIARDTEGVTRVVNQLRIRGESRTGMADASPDDRAAPDATAERDRQTQDADENIADPDGWLTAKVQAKFFMDREVKGRQINVDTRDGVVTLTGDVESAAERRQAVALAHNTEGVRSVNDQLQVRSTDAARADESARRDGTAGTPGRSNEQAVEDGWITTILQSKYFLDRDIKGRDINVDTRNGVVTLQGEVESDIEKQAAQAIAEETEGVNRVVNQLSVTARQQR